MRHEPIEDLVKKAKSAAKTLFSLPGSVKNAALLRVHKELNAQAEEIFAANARDLEASTHLSEALQRRLAFGPKKLKELSAGLESLVGLADPVGSVTLARELTTGLTAYKVRCPIGLIAMIFESRPDAAVQMASLAIKSANGIILKGGSESQHSVALLSRIIHDAACAEGLPEGWLVCIQGREQVQSLFALDSYIDLIIPRGSNDFVRYIMNNSKIPVLGHADGICHLYIHEDADFTMARELVIDSKTQYVAVCNALETLLVNEGIAQELLPLIAKDMSERGVEVRACEKSRAIIPQANAASEADWSSEYLDKILSIKLVSNIEEACTHINRYGSAHSDGIVTASSEGARQFMNAVDTANALWNTSTRFVDGFRYGLGAEVGIATGKLHARGPMGMEDLCTYQWRLKGSGNCVAGVESEDYTHRDISAASYPFA